MSLRIVPTHVRSAIPTVETERDRITTERDALAKFLNRVSDLSVSRVIDVRIRPAIHLHRRWSPLKEQDAPHPHSRVFVMHTTIPS